MALDLGWKNGLVMWASHVVLEEVGHSHDLESLRALLYCTVVLPVAISHKASLKPKRCACATLIQTTSKNEQRTKEKHFHGPIFGTVWRYQK